MTPPNAGDLKERLLKVINQRSVGYSIKIVCREAADHIERLKTDLGGTAMAFEQYRNVTTDKMEALKSQLAEARKALGEIANWKYDTLGPRPKEFGPLDCDPSISSAFDRGVRMALYRCADRAAAPSPRPRREDIAFPRAWIVSIRDGLVAMGKLPTGPLGDWAFLFRDQLTDALDKAAPPPAVPTQEEPVAWSYESWIGGYCWSRKLTEEKPAGEEWERNIVPLFAAPPPAGADAVREADNRDAYEIFDYARQAVLKKGGTLKQAEISGLHAAIVAAYDVFPAPQPQEKPECTCGGDPDQPASHHDISCPAALPDDLRKESK